VDGKVGRHIGWLWNPGSQEKKGGDNLPVPKRNVCLDKCGREARSLTTTAV